MPGVFDVMKHFRPHEFDCRCQYGCGLGFAAMDPDFLERLDMARLIAGVPFKINSAVRCEQHNHDIGGKVESSHLAKPKAMAVDVEAKTPHARYRILYGMIKAGFTRIGVYPDFIHGDTDKSKAPEVVWLWQ